MPTQSDLTQTIIGAVLAVSPTAGTISADTCLMGQGAVLDSIGFVTLLVQLEQDLGNAVDLSSSFIEQSGVEEAKHPFLTVGSLAQHLERLMSSD
jgi:acyl carrier protein